MAAQVNRIQSIQHNLQDYPVKVDVQVKIRHNNNDYIFTASRSSQRDDDSNIPYGGAVYIYNQNEIIVTFPVRNNQQSAGGLAYTGKHLKTRHDTFFFQLTLITSYFVVQ